MSDVTNTEGAETPDEEYNSQVDPLFSQAWNSVFSPKPANEDPQGTIEIDDPANRAPAPTPADEGAGTEPPAKDAQDAGTLPDAGGPAEGEPANGDAATEPATDGEGDGDAGNAPEPASGVGELEAPAQLPLFDIATKQIEERMQESFQRQAYNEVAEKIDPKYFEILQKHPRELVGMEVPSVRGSGNETLRDTQDARDWQEATAKLIRGEIQSIANAKSEDMRETMSIVQDSIQRFQNNPDLIPHTKQFDRELADKFAEMAKAYEYRVNGKLLGYQVNVQPLINSIRADLEKQRGANRVKQQQAQQQKQTRQQQAQNQPRTPTGQFDAPQASIPSKAEMSGEPGEDMSAFWSASGIPEHVRNRLRI